jgi:transglutaminase-like putative cysteine protease
MAVERTIEKAPGSRLLLLTALLTLSAVSAAAFGRVFQGSRPTLQLIAAAGAAVLLAGALENRHVALATLVSAVGLAVAIGLLVFRSTTWFGLPTATTFRAAVRAWEAIGQTARTEVAPTRPFAPLFLAGLTAVWAASFSSHALASRARSPFLALLPPAGLLAFTSIILEEGARPLYVLVFLTAAIAVLFADGLRRVGQWGPITVWHARRKARLTTSSTTRGARWVAVVTLAVAMFLPGILPGYRAQGLVRVHGPQSGAQVTIDPIVQIKPYLRLTQPVPLFTVRATQAAYWRLTTLDQFTGKLWTSSDLEATGGFPVRSGPLPGAVDRSGGKVIAQHFQFLRLSQTLLPAASEPVVFDGTATARYDPRTGALVVPGGASKGFTYDVRSVEVIPSPKELEDVASLAAAGAARYTLLPEGMRHRAEITELASEWTEAARDPYRKILAIQDRLRNPKYFTYSENVPAGHGADDILHFLTVTRRGYCEQFAGSMAVLLRSLGIPARVAVGFTPGIPQGTTGKSTLLRVTTQQAHAWVEVLFPKYGWLAFEPTPSRFNAEAASYAFPFTNPPSETGGNKSGQKCERLVTGPAAHEPQNCLQGDTGGKPGAERPTGEPPGSKSLRTPASTGHRVSGQALIWWGLLGAALLFGAGIPFVKLARRRLILRKARGASEVVLAAFRVLDERAGDVGLGRWPAETLREYGDRLVVSVKGLDGNMESLTRLAGRAAYSAGTISDDQAEEARTTAREVGRTIRRSAGVERRILGSLRVRRP